MTPTTRGFSRHEGKKGRKRREEKEKGKRNEKEKERRAKGGRRIEINE